VVYEAQEGTISEGAGKVWLYVEPDGDVLPTQGQSEKVLGNLLRDEWTKIMMKAE
jgi:MoaA/NifB/PqqE/SkfB family radical SAM enzyme